MMKRIFVIQNTELNSHLPLSVYLTGLLINFKKDEFIQKNIEFNLIISKTEKVPDEIKEFCSSIHQINTSLYRVKDNLKFSFQTFKILKKENKKNKIDIVHPFYPNSSLLGSVMFKILINSKVKIIYDIRSPWIEMIFARKHIKSSLTYSLKKILYLEERLLLFFVNYFIFITPGLKNFYKKKFKLNRLKRSIIPSGVDTKVFKSYKNKKYITNLKKRFGYKRNHIVIGHVGTVCYSRRLDQFLDIFEKAYQKNKNLRLFFLGGGADEGRLKKIVLSKNLDKVITFHPKTIHSNVPKFISLFDYGLCHLADIFVYRNSFALKILEYLSCKKPVLVSDIKTHREIKKDFENSLNNPVIIYQNPEDISRLRNNVQYNFKKIRDYSWNNLTKKYLSIWNNLDRI